MASFSGPGRPMSVMARFQQLRSLGSLRCGPRRGIRSEMRLASSRPARPQHIPTIIGARTAKRACVQNIQSGSRPVKSQRLSATARTYPSTQPRYPEGYTSAKYGAFRLNRGSAAAIRPPSKHTTATTVAAATRRNNNTVGNGIADYSRSISITVANRRSRSLNRTGPPSQL